MKKTILISLAAFAGFILAEESKQTPTVESLQAELSTLRAKYAQCQQEMALWQNIPVMETRLNLARELAKEAEREAAKKKAVEK